MLNRLVHFLFWSKYFQGIREAHRKMCYELGREDQEREYSCTYILDERGENTYEN